ncbi:MAG: hypothetical protein ACLQL2_01505 [Methylovirgula sp.]
MRLGRIRVALAIALALGSSEAAWAQSSNAYDWFAPPPPRSAPYYHRYHQRCSLDQREYAYINECGELIPGMWDWIPGSG